MTRDEWEAKGRELFGDNAEDWVFVCPSCGHEASVSQIRAAYPAELERFQREAYAIGQECIGRHVPDVGCDWAAFGLFRGPIFVDGVAAFDFAGKPFTGLGVAR